MREPRSDAGPPLHGEEASVAPGTGVAARTAFYVGSAGLLCATAADSIAVLGRHTGFERGHFHRIDHAKLGTCDMPGPPLRFSDSVIQVGPPPNLGEHNHAVFVDLLGMDEAEVAGLVRSGALA